MPVDASSTRKSHLGQDYDSVPPIESEDDSAFDEDDDPAVLQAQNSREVAEHDRELLNEEEERENLLTAGTKGSAIRSFFSRRRKDDETPGDTATSTRRQARRTRRERRRRRKRAKVDGSNEEGELMYEMEEGGPRDDISSQASISSVELDKLQPSRSSRPRRRKIAIWHIVTISIVALFCLLSFGAYKVDRQSHKKTTPSLLSNGSSTFAPTTIIISLDGFRADFLQRGITPTLNQFIAEGVSPRYMLPSFPSVTFPNHYTLVTGLYPESHGIVGNTFWAPSLNEEFVVEKASLQKKWWTEGEPIWVTAGKQDIRTAIHMWPGSEAGMEYSADYVDKFNGSEVLSRKTERILELLDLPGIDENPTQSERPQLIAAYVPVVDADGHSYGPNSTEIWGTISDVDLMLHNLFTGLHNRNLTNIVNVVVVSDHGMATTSTDRCIQLDDLIDLNLVEHIDGWPLYGLRPRDPLDLRGLYDRLLVESQNLGTFQVYLRDENMPERYHFSNNERIAPLWVVPDAGYAIVHREDFDIKEAKANGETYHPKGLHGYDHEHPLMRAIFIARGPAFLHKPNSRLEVFQNTEVYNIICDSINLDPNPNNGTLRLPLKPIGLHSDEPSPAENPPTDLPPENAPIVAGEAAAGKVHGFPKIPDLSETTPETGSNPQEGQPVEDGESTDEMNDFWAYVKAKIAAAQAWADAVIASWKGSGKGSEKADGSFEQGDATA